MAQHDFNIANQGFSSFRTDLNNALSAIQTTSSGTSTPTGAVAGQIWLDTSTGANTPTLKYYDGADNISLATIDHVGNTVNWLDSTVSITGISTTATGTVLTLTDSVSTSTVNLIIDNQKEIRFRETTANGTNYVALKAPASLSADLTFTLPSADGTNGQVLTTNGSGVLSFTTPSTGLAWQSTIVTAATLTAVANRGYWINTTSNACTITLPGSASVGDELVFVDYARNWGTNKITINQNSLNFQGATSPNPEYDTDGQSVSIVYSGSTQGWIPTVDDDVTLETPQPYSIDFLVIAGGGSGGVLAGGGGGAGGFRTSTQAASLGTVITVTVGDGGASASIANGNAGSNSSISGSGLTTITSAGGGYGTDYAGGAGGNGGSGGGSGGGSPSQSGGTGNSPSTSPSQGNNGGIGAFIASRAGAGGGGAGAVGGNGDGNSPGTSGNGGNGTANSITGSSVTRAGGGGGGTNNPAPPAIAGTGGTGGGGNGAGNPANNGTAGTTNTGSGGGAAAATPYNSGAGGKGVVILSFPTANYSSTTTGSPTVTTSGANTILQFNGSGSYTT